MLDISSKMKVKHLSRNGLENAASLYTVVIGRAAIIKENTVDILLGGAIF